jgi:hypothetical protein
MVLPQPLPPFFPVGRWILDDSIRSGIRFILSNFADARVIYAFAADDKIVYIGVCEGSTTTLQDRMARYQSRAGTGTNQRIAERIQRALSAGVTVTIHAWSPGEGPTIHGILIDLVKGLENPLIRALAPEWNIRA